MKALFQNPKAALAYVGFTLVSVVLFVGTEADPGSLHQTVSTFEGEQSGVGRAANGAGRRFGDPPPGTGMAAQDAGPAPLERNDVVVEFASDEELIDPAQGFNPNPSPERPLISQDQPEPEDVVGGWSD